MGNTLVARSHTDSIVLIEGGSYGTTCALVGCMPSKLLIASADVAHQAQHAEPFGVQVQGVRIDGAAVMQRVQRDRDRFVGFVLESVEAIAPAERRRPDGPRPAHLHCHRQHSELGQAMSRLGVHVKVFGVGGGIAGIHDPEIRACANQTFNAEFYLDAWAQVASVTESGTGVEIRYRKQAGDWQTEVFDYVLAATGRAPDFTGLDLPASHLPLNERGVPLV